MGKKYSTQTSLVLSILSLFTVIIFMYFDNYNVINKKCYIFSLLKGLKFKKTKLSQSLSLSHPPHIHTHRHMHTCYRQSQARFTIYIWHDAYGQMQEIGLLGEEVGADGFLKYCILEGSGE